MTRVKLLLSILNPTERIKIAILLFTGLIGSAIDAVGVGLILPVIALISDPGIIEKYSMIKELFLMIGFTSHSQFIIAACGALVVFFLVKNVYLIYYNTFQLRVLLRIQTRLSLAVFNLYLGSPFAFHLQRNSAELYRNVVSVVPTLISPLLISMIGFITEVFVVICIFGILLLADTFSALVVLVGLGGLTCCFHFLSRKQAKRRVASQEKHAVQFTKIINGSLRSIKDVKMFDCKDYLVRTITPHFYKYNEHAASLQIIALLPRFVIEFVAVAAMLSIVITNIVRNRPFELILPILAVFAMAAFRLMPSTIRIVNLVVVISSYLDHVELLKAELEQLTYKSDQFRHNQPTADEIAKIHGRVEIDPSSAPLCELRDVSFAYGDSPILALSHVSLVVNEGDIIGVIGVSGAGKSTLVNIILGLLTPMSGDILFHGKSIKDSDVAKSWQHQIGYVPQSIMLAGDTVLENVAFGIERGEINKERVWESLRMAQLEEFVRELPLQLDTVVGENGVRFSGGQQQRLGIARALYRNPSIIVLDEATSSLDVQTEREFNLAIKELTGKKTMIIVSHRPNSIENCNIVYNVKNGCLDIVSDFSLERVKRNG